MANLIIDIGNVAVKAAWADGYTLGKCYRYQGERIAEFVSGITARQKADVMVVSSTRKIDDSLVASLSGCCTKLVVLKEENGTDRYAAVTAASHMFKGRNVLVFDFGSVINIDLIDSSGKHVGGNISLGLRSRYKAVNRYSSSLPLLSDTGSFPQIGVNIEESIHSGVNSGIIFEVEGYMRRYPDSAVIFTGGDAFYFAKQFKTPIFVVCNLVLMGLAIIAVQNEIDETD